MALRADTQNSRKAQKLFLFVALRRQLGGIAIAFWEAMPIAERTSAGWRPPSWNCAEEAQNTQYVGHQCGSGAIYCARGGIGGGISLEFGVVYAGAIYCAPTALILYHSI